MGGGVSNPGVAVSAMAEEYLQKMIHYMKSFKIIGCTCTHADVELSKVSAMYHQQDMEEAHKSLKWYLPLIQGTDPIPWKQWKST